MTTRSRFRRVKDFLAEKTPRTAPEFYEFGKIEGAGSVPGLRGFPRFELEKAE